MQWLHNFKYPDGLTARWLKKLAEFDYVVQHRPGKSIGHDDGFSRTPIVHQITTTQNKENLDQPQEIKFFGLIFDSKDSLAHRISSDFKKPKGTSRNFERKFPYIFPESTNFPLFVQRTDDQFIYYLVTKKRLFRKPTNDTLRQSLEAMTHHARANKVTRISMPKAGVDLID